ncbi:MAG: hypothetical protein RI911_335, partial [Candidatus Parcubacteria bacterium]
MRYTETMNRAHVQKVVALFITLALFGGYTAQSFAAEKDKSKAFERVIDFKLSKDATGKMKMLACEKRGAAESECRKVEINGTNACFTDTKGQKQCGTVEAACSKMQGSDSTRAECTARLKTGDSLFGGSECPEQQKAILHCTNGKAEGEPLTCGGSSFSLPYMTLGYQQDTKSPKRFSMKTSCKNNTAVAVELVANGNTTIVKRENCPVSELSNGKTAV